MKSREAFSLVEVVIAIALVSFCLVAVLGLLMTSLNSGKKSKDDTLIAVMAGDVSGELQRQMFTNFPGVLTAPSSTNYYDASGLRLSSATGAIYQCTSTIAGDPNSVSADGSTNLLFVTMNFTWPVGVTPPPNSQSLNATLSKY